MTHIKSDIPSANTPIAPVAILGFGVAGFNAAVGLRSGGYTGEIEVFSDIDTIPYSPIMTSYYAAGMVSYEDCFPWTQEEVNRLGLILHNNVSIQSLDTKEHVINTAEGSFPYSKCVIATGASPVVFGFEESSYSPLVLHSMEEAERLREILHEPNCKRILISGASMVAVKMLEAALVADKECTLVGMNGQILDMTAFPEAAARFERNLAKQGVSFRFNQTIQEVAVLDRPEHPRGHVLQVVFSNGEIDTFDEICAAHGFRSNLAYLEPESLKVDRGILVNEYMRTSDPDVYAAGDVAQALELISLQPQMVGIWKNAAVQGLCAGRAIACELTGKELSALNAYAGSIASNTISCNGPLFISAGSSTISDSRSLEVVEDDEMTIVYLFEEDRLVGFNICADEDIEGGTAYDLGGMLTRTILESCK